MTKKVCIEYLLSEAGRKKSLLAGGDGKEQQVIEADITPDLLKRASVYVDGQAKWRVKYVQTGAEIIGTYNFSPYRLDVGDDFYESHKPRIKPVVKDVWFDEPQTAESLLAFVSTTEEKAAAEIAKLEELLPGKIAAWEKAVEEHREKARAAAEREAEKARREQEKADWIAAHGSDYLKRATALGYDCQWQYVTERAAMELPDFEVDFDDRAAWKSRSCPSEEALAEVERLIGQGYNAECVWLTHPPYEMEDEGWESDNGFPCEAIAVRGYLGKYDLVKII